MYEHSAPTGAAALYNNHSGKKNLVKFRVSCIRVRIEQLEKDRSILNSFKQVVLIVDKLKHIRLEDGYLEKIHLALTAFIFHAYSGFRW